MKAPPIVSAQEWDAAWREMLVMEKEVQRARDALAAQRRRMPWLAVEKEYTFDGPYGKASLLDLFDGRSRAEPRPSQRPRHHVRLRLARNATRPRAYEKEDGLAAPLVHHY